ncbi:MAG TPA: glycosyltransferase, partial [Luteitalea sp.]|nr:glycosyltransferase [Luteitalea sp.]
MKVLASIRQRSFARFVAFDLADAARRLGWAVLWIDVDAETQRLRGQPADAWLAARERLARDITAFAPDVVFSYGLEAFVPPFPDGLPDDRWCIADHAGAAIAAFFYDFGAPFDRPIDAATRPLIDRLQQIDVRVFCWDRAAVTDLHRYGVAAEYLPMAVNDAMFHPPATEVTRDLDVVFTGGPTAERIAALRPLAGVRLSIYGYDEAGWRADAALGACYRELLPGRDDLRALYGRARITPNITRAQGRASLNMRVFEAMACGCLVVTDQAEAARDLFPADDVLVTVGHAGDIAPVVTTWLADEPARARVAAEGARVVRSTHTYVHRLQELAPRLATFVAESRAWPHLLRYLHDDAAKALRFVAALRSDRALLREDVWHAAEADAHLRLHDDDG